MISDERVSRIVNEVLREESDKTVEAFLKIDKLNQKITGSRIEMNYKSMLLLYPTNLLEYVDNIEKTITYTKEQGKIIEKAQKQLERWISIYESNDIVAECYEYLRQEKQKLDTEFRKNTRAKGTEESILKASGKIGGISLRNLQRESNNLSGELEEYPYSKIELETINEYNEIERKMGILEEYNEKQHIEENADEEEQE